MARCPDCNKFVSLETQEPEVNDISLEDRTVTAEVRLARNCQDCGTEMKEYTFSLEDGIPDDIWNEMEKVKETDPEAEFNAEEGSADIIEEGGGRYQKSYYGVDLSVNITAEVTVDGKKESKTLGVMNLKDKMAASDFDDLT